MAYKFGVRDCKLAPWTSTGVYGAAVDVPAIQEATVQLQTNNAELPGDDVIVDTHAQATSAQVTLRNGMNTAYNVASDVISAITGVSSNSSSGGTTRVRSIGGINFPYLGIAIQQYDTGVGGGDLELMVRKAKIMEGFQYSFQNGQYNVMNLTFKAVPDNDVIIDEFDHATAQALTVPPTVA